jgi:hypothetical protein
MARHPTDERPADQSTPSASGLPGGEPASAPKRDDDDLIARNRKERHDTPRRYEDEKTDDPAMPSDDSSLTTKI